LDIGKLHNDLEPARAKIPSQVDIIHAPWRRNEFPRFRGNELLDLFYPFTSSFQERTPTLAFLLMGSFVVFIEEPRVGIEDHFFKRDSEGFIVDRPQRSQCRVPERDATCDYFFNSGVKITVLGGMKVVDIARNPEKSSNSKYPVNEAKGKGYLTYLTPSSLDISTSQGSHWNFRLNNPSFRPNTNPSFSGGIGKTLPSQDLLIQSSRLVTSGEGRIRV
jgi:hypothetical protein